MLISPGIYLANHDPSADTHHDNFSNNVMMPLSRSLPYSLVVQSSAKSDGWRGHASGVVAQHGYILKTPMDEQYLSIQISSPWSVFPIDS
jgi:hypothetical protein